MISTQRKSMEKSKLAMTRAAMKWMTAKITKKGKMLMKVTVMS